MRRLLQIILRYFITPLVIFVGSLSLTDYAAGSYPHRIWLSTIVSIVASGIVTMIWIRVERTTGCWWVSHLRHCALLYLLLPLYVLTLREGLTAPGGRIATVGTISAILVNAGVIGVRSWFLRRNSPSADTKPSTGTA